MSRIHEALKQAELDRAATQQSPVNGSRLNSPANGNVEERNATKMAVADISQAVLPGEPNKAATQLEAVRASCAHPVWNPDLNVNVFLNPTMEVHVTEQFRTLRSRLNQLRTVQPLRKLLITSPLAAEGKTFVVHNLAQAIVRQDNRSALVIDADLRRSNLHSHVGGPLTPGLSDYLRGQASEMEIIQHGMEGNLFFIPGGSPASNPSELLSNGRLATLLDRLATIFDWVILDSPPVYP